MKKSIFLFFAAILCAMTANAYNQSAVDLYFDNSEAKWSSCYVYIGHSTWTSCYPLTRVSGTQYLWKLAKADFNGGSSWNSATGWVLCYEKWWDSKGESIDKFTWHGDKNVTQKRTSAWSASYIYKTNGTASTTSDSHTITAYKTTTVSNKNYTVTINTVEGGTLTVKDYDNNAVATGASKIYLTVLKFSATPADGYVLDAVEINDGTNTTTIAAADLATTTHTLKSNVTINPVWRATTSTVTVTATATNGTVTGGGVVEEGTSVTLTATPDAGYQFVNWTVAGAEVSTANPYTFTADADVEVVANFEELPKATIYFVNNGGWSKIQAYAWGDNGTNASWAGVDITANKLAEKIGEYDVYSYTVIQGSYKNVIFNDGSAQTADYVWTDGNYYWYDSAIKNEDKFAGGTKAQAEEKFSVPVVNTYTVVGSSAPLFGEAWATGKVENDMTLVEGTKYELVKTDVSLTVGEIQYKVAVNHAWDEAYPGENAILNISEAGKYTVTFTFDSNTKAVNATAELTEAAVVLPTVGVKGAWDGWAATTTLTGDNTSASATVNIATAGIYEFGLDVDGNFQASGATIDKANNSTVVTTNAGNMKLTANVLGDYTFTWTYETKTLTVTYPAGEEVDLNKYYVIGLSGNWDIVPANELVPVSVGSKEYSLVANMTAGTHEFKVSDATKDNTYGYAQLTKKNYNELSEGEYSNIKLTLAANAEVTITFNGETKAITLTSTALTENVAALTYTVTVPAGTAKCYICGAWDWNTFMEMTPTANANEFTIDIVGATTAQEYKYTRGEGWEYAEVNADGSTRANRTYNANDVVEKWADVITYVLMGVNGDWTTGIQLTKNSDTEYMLLGQTITRNTDKVKVVTLTNGNATAYCGNVDTYSDAIYENDWDDAGNIVLEDGIYDFYFKLNDVNDADDDQIYIDQTTLLRTGSNKYGTIYIPYTPASVSGATFYQVAGKEEGKVYLESVNTVEAGKPYIYERTGNQVVKIEFSGTKATNGGAVNGLVGTDVKYTVVAPGHYLLYNNAFCKSDGSSKVRGYRAYLVMEDIVGGQPTQMPGRRYIGMSVQGENEATGFENITAPEGQVLKTIVNGQLIIIRNGEKFNAQGVRF
ncbi:MAG: starch-binding protein [Paludibacteraceae bacterium]|nr:starch-binding protein [Paludibacteraceae bacterium]